MRKSQKARPPKVAKRCSKRVCALKFCGQCEHLPGSQATTAAERSFGAAMMTFAAAAAARGCSSPWSGGWCWRLLVDRGAGVGYGGLSLGAIVRVRQGKRSDIMLCYSGVD